VPNTPSQTTEAPLSKAEIFRRKWQEKLAAKKAKQKPPAPKAAKDPGIVSI